MKAARWSDHATEKALWGLSYTSGGDGFLLSPTVTRPNIAEIGRYSKISGRYHRYCAMSQFVERAARSAVRRDVDAHPVKSRSQTARQEGRHVRNRVRYEVARFGREWPSRVARPTGFRWRCPRPRCLPQQ
jgi:hypothetical protein